MAPPKMPTVSSYPQPPPPKKKSSFWTPLPPKIQIWTPKNGPSLRISESIRVPSPSPMDLRPLPLPSAALLMTFLWVASWSYEPYFLLNWGKLYHPSPDWSSASVNAERTFCPLNIRYIFTLSVIHPFLIRQSPLVDQSLSATCPLNMRYSCVLWAPHTLREDPHRHRDDFHHWMKTG